MSDNNNKRKDTNTKRATKDIRHVFINKARPMIVIQETGNKCGDFLWWFIAHHEAFTTQCMGAYNRRAGEQYKQSDS